MPFFELLQNTDILITVGSVHTDLSNCLPMSGIPYLLSLGNRPLLWHCLAPLVDAGGQNFFISTTPEWRSTVKTCVEEFALHHHLKTNLDHDSSDNNNNNNNNDKKKDEKSSVSHSKNSNNNNTTTTNVIVGEINFFFVSIEESDCTENLTVAQVVNYARHNRAVDSIRDFMVVNFDTLLSPEVIKTFLQGFQTNFASVSVLFAERNPGIPEDAESDLICVDDDVSENANDTTTSGAGENNNNSTGNSSQFAEHRRLHMSEPLPCDTKHDFRSSMLMRRPQMVFSKNFKQLPVYLFRPWVAQALQLHFEAAYNHQQQEKEGGSNNTKSPSGGNKNNKNNSSSQKFIISNS